MRVGSYNIRFEQGDKGTQNAWTERSADVVKLIEKLDLDAFGLQEVCSGQADYLTNNLPQYTMVGAYREGGKRKGQATPVFYRKDRFNAVKSGTFWLSETPDVPGSKSWDTACPRICTWVRLTDKVTGRTFCFANTHTDHNSELARTEGMKLIMKRMREFAPDGMPVVFTGDHNCGEWEETAKIASAVLRDTVHATETPPVGPYRTYNGFRWRENPPAAEVVKMPVEKRRGRGDYIYVSKGVRVKSHVCHSDTRPGMKLGAFGPRTNTAA
jgi:endonuclease/exonuclease/phosphatase family metal-dependent hydrolase